MNFKLQNCPQFPTLTKPKLVQTPDRYLQSDNLESIADSLQIVAAMPLDDAKTALNELRSVWRRDAMGQASLLLKKRDRTAYDRVFALVLEVKS